MVFRFGSFAIFSITFLTQEEVQRLFSAIKTKRDHAIFAVAYRHGLRASEVGILQLTDLDLKAGRITINRVNHRPAKPKIPKPLVYAQVSPLGPRRRGRRLRSTAVRRSWKRQPRSQSCPTWPRCPPG